MPLYPPIHERVTGSGVPALHLACCADERDIRNATDVDDGRRDPGLRNLGLMKCGDQWRALSTRCHISAAEVGDDADARHLCEAIGIADLPGIGRRALRVMPYRLAVTADGANVFRAHVGLCQESIDRFRVGDGQLLVQHGHAVQFIRARVPETEDLLAQRPRHLRMMRLQQPAAAIFI